MNLVVHIPKWLLWLVGVPLGIALLLLAAFGVLVLWSFRDWKPMGY